MPDEEWMECCSSRLQVWPGGAVHCTAGALQRQLPQLQTRREAQNLCLRCHSAPSGHRPPAVPSLPAALPHAPRSSSNHRSILFFFAHSVAIGHDAFRDTREKDFVVIQKELVSRSLSEDAFATVRSSFLPASCAPSFPSFSFPVFPSPTPPSAQSAHDPPPLRLTQK